MYEKEKMKINSAAVLFTVFFACALAIYLSLENDLFKTLELRLTTFTDWIFKTSTSTNLSMMGFDNFVELSSLLTILDVKQ